MAGLYEAAGLPWPHRAGVRLVNEPALVVHEVAQVPGGRGPAVGESSRN